MIISDYSKFPLNLLNKVNDNSNDKLVNYAQEDTVLRHPV